MSPVMQMAAEIEIFGRLSRQLRRCVAEMHSPSGNPGEVIKALAPMRFLRRHTIADFLKQRADQDIAVAEKALADHSEYMKEKWFEPVEVSQ